MQQLKKEQTLTFCDSMDVPGECYAKRDKPVGESKIPHDLTYLWNLMNKINLWAEQKQKHKHIK